MTIKDRTCIAGVGFTDYYKRGQSGDKSALAMCCESILAACEDSGIAVEEIDGFSSYADSNSAAIVAAKPKVEELKKAVVAAQSALTALQQKLAAAKTVVTQATQKLQAEQAAAKPSEQKVALAKQAADQADAVVKQLKSEIDQLRVPTAVAQK